MWLMYFAVGLCIGLVILGSYLILVIRRIHRLLRKYGCIPTDLSLSSFLTLVIAPEYYETYLNNREVSYQYLESTAVTWQRVMENAPIGYLQVDEENRLLWCNTFAAQLFDIKDLVTTLTAKRLLLQLVRSYELDRLIEQTRQTQQSSQLEWVFHKVIADPLHPIPSQAQTIRGSSIALNDGCVGIFIENRQETVDLAQQRDRWASDVAHELKTPLTSIRLIAEMLEDRIEPSLNLWLERLINEVIRLSNLVQDLLDLSQLETGIALKLNLETINLPELLQAAWLSLEPLAAKRHLTLDYRGPQQATIQGDRSRLHRLFLNLLDNSIKYSPPDQAIVAQINCLAEWVSVEVIDRGGGFPVEALPYVFDRFYRVDRSRARSESERGGSGLGLAIVQRIAQAHQGSVTADNHPETGGAWLTVNLPTNCEGIRPIDA